MENRAKHIEINSRNERMQEFQKVSICDDDYDRDYDIVFRDDEHERIFFEALEKLYCWDNEHIVIAYLIGLDTVCRAHIDDLFDFEKDTIKPEALGEPWQTGTSLKTTRLLFNLWNGYTEDSEQGRNYTPESLFCTGYAPYYWQAIKLRYPDYCEY